MVAPDEGEIARAIAELGVPEALVRHGLDRDELARVDHDPSGALLVVIRIPAGESASGDGLQAAHAVGVMLIGDAAILVVSLVLATGVAVWFRAKRWL